ALAWGAAWGPGAGLGAALSLGAALTLSRPVNGIALSSLNSAQWQSLANGIMTYVLAAVAAGAVSRVLMRSSEQVRAATEEAIRARERAARLAERDSLARAIHDSVLQALALIHKRGREVAGTAGTAAAEVRNHADMAAQQEEVLRGLILREPEEAPATGLASLRDRLESLSRGS